MVFLTVNRINTIFEKQGWIQVPWGLYMRGAYMRDYRQRFVIFSSFVHAQNIRTQSVCLESLKT